MKYIPDDYGERCRFDAFCKTVLRNEARTHLRDLGRQRNREIEFSALSQQEMDKLCTVDEYPSDSFLFTAYGYALHIRDELVADAFASLPESRLRGLWDFLYWLQLSAVCLESERCLQGYSRPEPVGQCLKCCLYLLL